MKYRTIKKLLVAATAAVLMAGTATTVFAATKLDTVSDPYWDEDDDTIAMWDEVEDAYQYEVYLYRDDSKVTGIKTKKTKYNFKNKMTTEGEYTFRVRALAKGSSSSFKDGNWSEYSDGTYVSEDYAELLKNGGKIDTQNSGPGSLGGESGTTPDSSVLYTPGWIQDTTGWWYRNADGSYPVNAWFQDTATGTWYYFNEYGYMVTGWLEWNGSRYYCGESGAMYSGTQTIDGVTYQFDSSGALTAA